MKTLIALTDINGRYEAWYGDGNPEHFTIEEIDLPTLDRMYQENMPYYQGLKIVDGCHMYIYGGAIMTPPNDKITMTQAEYNHRLRMAREDGYQKGLYDGITHAVRNRGKRMVAQAHIRDGEVVEAAVDATTYDPNLFSFIQWRNQ